MVRKELFPDHQAAGRDGSVQPLDTDVQAKVQEANRQIIAACTKLGRDTRQAWMAIGAAVFMVLYGGDRARYESHAREKGVSLRDLAAGSDLGHSTLGNCVTYHLQQRNIPKAIRGLVSPAVELRYLQAAKIPGARALIDADIAAGPKITVASINARIREARGLLNTRKGRRVLLSGAFPDDFTRLNALINEVEGVRTRMTPSTDRRNLALDKAIKALTAVRAELGDPAKVAAVRDAILALPREAGWPIATPAQKKAIMDLGVDREAEASADKKIKDINDAPRDKNGHRAGISDAYTERSQARRNFTLGVLAALDVITDQEDRGAAHQGFLTGLRWDPRKSVLWDRKRILKNYASKYPNPEGDKPYGHPLKNKTLCVIDTMLTTFNEVPNAFQDDNRMQCASFRSPSPLRLLTDSKTRHESRQHFDYLVRGKNQGLNLNVYRGIFSDAAYVADQFKPAVAKAIYQLKAAEWGPGRWVERILDLSCGWGGRLAAFHMTPTVKEYVGCDPSDATFPVYLKQCLAYDRWLREATGYTGPDTKVIEGVDKNGYPYFRVEGVKVVEIHRCPAQKFNPDGEFDMAFTSPPYFGTERYNEGGAHEGEQSWQFGTYPEWRDVFLKPATKVMFDKVKPDGVVVVNMMDPKIDRREFACDDMVKHFECLGAKYLGHGGFKINKRRADRENSDDKRKKVEDLWFFSKRRLTLGPSAESTSDADGCQDAEPVAINVVAVASPGQTVEAVFGIDSIILKATPVETYDLPGLGPVLVKREDMACVPPGPPFSKVRGLFLLMRDLKAAGTNVIAYMDTSISMAGWGISYFASQMDMKAIIFYPAYKEGPRHNLAHHKALWEKFGAEVVPIEKPNLLKINFRRAMRIMKEKYPDGGYHMIEQGFPTPHSLEQISLEVDTIPANVGTIVLSCGSGTTTAGIVRGLARRGMNPDVVGILADRKNCAKMAAKITKLAGVPEDATASTGVPRLSIIDTDIGYHDPVEMPCPFPCNRYYDRKAWKWLAENFTNLAKPVLFWNVGADGTDPDAPPGQPGGTGPMGRGGPLPRVWTPPTSLAAALTGFRRVRPEDQATFTPYFEGREINHKKPRFYMSPMALGNGRAFWWKEVGGCLCMLKRRSDWNPVLQLVVPPMSPTGDLTAEKAVIEAFRMVGVSCELGDEDVALYGYKKDLTKKHVEYLYRAGDFATPPSGDRGKMWRWSLNRCATLGLVVREWHGGVPADVIEKCRFVSSRWLKNKQTDLGLAAKQVPDIGLLGIYNAFAAAAPGSTRLMLIEDPKGDPMAFTIQQAVPGGCVLLMRYHDIHHAAWGGIDIARLTHLLDCRAASAASGPDTICTLGAAVGPMASQMAAAKEKLIACGEVQVYHLTPLIKLTWELWQAADPEQL
jgi:1-aminocyclopropane-1-carboxylate deaminase/D-cysteine desulfhydrase-like pyridoxal-dependent ACC family enzyme